MQIEGEWGGASVIDEMLLQSQTGFIRLVPALADSWKTGKFQGLKVRGGATVDLAWKNGKAQQATITAMNDGVYTLKNPTTGNTVVIDINGKKTKSNDEMIELDMKSGETANIQF